MRAAARTPAMRVVITTDEAVPTTETYLDTDRLLYARAIEQPYSGDAEVWLLNQDNALTAKDYRGRRVVISWGYVSAGAVRDYQPRADHWVIEQHNVSSEGRNYLVLRMTNVFGLLALHATVGETIGAAAPFNPAGTITDSVKVIIDALLAKLKPAGYAGGILAYTPVTLDIYSPFVTTGIYLEYKPTIHFNAGDDLLFTIIKVVEVTKCTLVARSGKNYSGNCIQVYYPDAAGAVDYTYDSAGPHVIVVVELKKSLTMPNKVTFVDLLQDGNGNNIATVIGTASDATSQAALGIINRISSPSDGASIGNSTGATPPISAADEATLRADIILFKLQQDVSTGVVVVPLNPNQEVWDKVTVTDGRTASSATGRVHTLDFVLDLRPARTKSRQRYDLTISLGNASTRLVSRLLPIFSSGMMSSDQGLASYQPDKPFTKEIDTPYFDNREQLPGYEFRHRAARVKGSNTPGPYVNPGAIGGQGEGQQYA